MPTDKRRTTPTPDPDLALIVARWPELPPAVRAEVVALVRSGLDGEDNR